LLKWVEGDAKQNPQTWPETRLKATLAHLHCLLADTWMALDRHRTALGALQQAERIFPESAELIGRQGLIAMSEGRYQEAATLLNQAIEGGCQYPEVYANLLDAWEELGDKQARTEARRRFGKLFGDFNVDAEVEIPHWISALSTQSYSLFSRLVGEDQEHDPALRACQIFVNAVQSPPNSGGRVSLNQATSGQKWDELLQSLSGKEQIPVLQAIALSIILFAKREKGIAGLSQQYAAKLMELSDEYPEAMEAYLVVLTIKESNAQKVHTAVRLYLERTPQPGNALAHLQLQVRYFRQTAILTPLIDEVLRREPQNPLLLLAKATTYAPESQPYEELREQGFELARRLQDAKALQAFRQEQAFVTTQDMAEFIPDPDELENFDEADMDDFLENMIRKFFGKQIPPSELERMLPQLKDMMFNNMPDIDEEDEDDGIDFDFVFGPKRPKKRRKKFRDL
jgi:tetratricopeptide (TPR) repeat protein